MQITCRSCSKVVPADDVNLDTVLAKCRGCDAVFDYADQVKGGVTSPVREKRERGEVPLPKNMTVAEGLSTLTVVRKWSRGLAFFFLFFSGFWNAIVLVFVVVAIAGGMNGQGPGAFIWLFLTPFILVGFGTGYAALALLLNSTTLKVAGTALTVTHHPIRWFGERHLDAAQVSQLYCTEYVAYSQNNVPQYRMMVKAVMNDGSRIDLVKGLEDPGQAIYLEQLLERYLGIEDRPVDEERRSGHFA